MDQTVNNYKESVNVLENTINLRDTSIKELEQMIQALKLEKEEKDEEIDELSI